MDAQDHSQAIFGHPLNGDVVGYLKSGPSAHSDIADELMKAAAGNPLSRWYCPDVQRYLYVAMHLPGGAIYALAIGMKLLVFRLPESQLPPEAKGKLQVFEEISPGWSAFEMFRSGDIAGDRALARLLCESAYHWTRSCESSAIKQAANAAPRKRP